ncbi:MAG: BBP7 family outer membrane beta-barrel protein [Planctomycetaceae bacterium]|nr:BBP7 family outer membrane beta-barrel protein [Planctomycetaceae bacterium]
MFLQRTPRISNQPIVVDATTGTTLLSTSDLDFNFAPGLQATVGKRLCGGRALEFDYLGLFEGNASAAAVSPDPAAFLIFPDNLVGNVFVGMDRTLVTYTSALQSFAVNLACCCGCCDECCCGEVHCQSLTWFAGFRYLNVSEELNITAQRNVFGGVENGTYNIRAANQLYGAQLGARLRRTRGRCGWEATGNAGIFGNDSQQTQSVTDFPNFPLRPTVSSRGAGVAFVGGANLSALYLLTNAWNLRAGYNVMWIEGLALAPDQLDFNFGASPSGNQLHNGGGLFLHGVNIGLEARW